MSALFLFPKSRKKKIQSTLYKLFGIGLTTAYRFSTIHGLGRQGTLNTLYKKYKKQVVLEILTRSIADTTLLIIDQLKEVLERRLKFHDSVKNFRSIRRTHNLPLNGQRTYANAKTVKRLHFTNLRKLEETGVLLAGKKKKRRKTRRERKLIRLSRLH